MDSIQKEQILNEYCGNEMQKLKQICYPKISKIGGISQMDHDDLYSIALDVLRYSVERYDDSQDCKFSTYLSGNIDRKFSTYVRDRLREKRSGEAQYDEDGNRMFNQSVSLDDSTEDGTNLSEKVASNCGIDFDDRVDEFLGKLRKTQQDILQLLMQGYNSTEIRNKLNISEKKYSEQFKELTSFENIVTIRRLFPKASKYIEEDKLVEKKEEETTMVTTQTAEKSKPMQYSIASINKKIENRTIRFDHPLQRESDQWNPSMKGNLISDILQGNPLPEIVFAEQIINGIPVVWDLDGKQRCTNCYSFANDGFKISRNIRRWNIQYLAQIKDENGKPVLDENGFPTSEYREFDIRNKKFSQLPEELQEKFLDYTFKCDQYLNCDSEEIAYNIIRYNEGKSMSKPQKGIIRIGEEFATMVKSISAMPFFREKGAYKMSEAKNGTLERVVVESVMASKYLKDWNKQQEAICEYLKDNATSEDFDSFEDMVNRLDEVITDEVADMFDSKDSFLWFGLFARFVNTGKDDEKFIEFMAEFGKNQSLHIKEVNGTTYKDLCVDKETGKSRSTKDKYIVIPKIELLTELMLKYLHINKEESQSKETENILDTVENNEISTLDFIKENVSEDVTEDDLQCYEEVLDDLTVEVDNNTPLLDEQNIKSLLALVAYSFQNDIDLDKWLPDYFRRVHTYNKNSKENYLLMTYDLNKFLEKGAMV